MAIDPNIIKKIHDLMRLSSSANENEAAAAFAKAQELLTKHRITMASVEDAVSKENAPSITGTVIEQGKRVITWKTNLLHVICKLNGCFDYIWHGTDKVGVNINGFENDVEIVKYMYESISQQIEFLAAKARELKLGDGKTFYNNYKLGIVSAVNRRLTEANAEAKKPYVGTTALAVIENRLSVVEKEIRNKVRLKNIPVVYSRQDIDGFRLGQSDGSKVNIAPGLGANSTKQLKV